MDMFKMFAHCMRHIHWTHALDDLQGRLQYHFANSYDVRLVLQISMLRNCAARAAVSSDAVFTNAALDTATKETARGTTAEPALVVAPRAQRICESCSTEPVAQLQARQVGGAAAARVRTCEEELFLRFSIFFPVKLSPGDSDILPSSCRSTHVRKHNVDSNKLLQRSCRGYIQTSPSKPFIAKQIGRRTRCGATPDCMCSCPAAVGRPR